MLQRLGAYLLDVGVVYIVLLGMSLGYDTLLEGLFQVPPLLRVQALMSIQESAPMLFSVMFFAYLFYCNYFAEGKSFGCLYYDFVVVGAEGKKPSGRQSFLRSVSQTSLLLCLWYPSFFLLALLPLVLKEHRSVADVISRSLSLLDEFAGEGPPSLVLIQDQEEPPPPPQDQEERSAA